MNIIKKGDTMTMILPLKRANVFTEEDTELSKVFNADALGLQMIWTYFGQKIYKHKINSTTFDVRSFNINLFNHFLLHTLEREGKLPYPKNRENYEKLLVLLENLVVWSGQDREDFESKGLSGASNAKNKWANNKKINIDISAKVKELELVKDQHIYGINGRYKGSFMSIGFFDSEYQYDEQMMQGVEKLILGHSDIKALYEKTFNWLSGENRSVENIPTDAYMKVFGKVNAISAYTKEFWLKHLGFDTGDAKVFYELVDKNDKQQDLKALFEEAAEKSEDGKNFENILKIEPVLAYLEGLFEYILLLDGKEISEIDSSLFQPIKDFNFRQFDLDEGSTVAVRLDAILKIHDIKSLISYHIELMHQRDKLPWVEIKDEKIKVLMIKYNNVNVYENYLNDKKDDLESIDWKHDYYKGIVRQIKGSLEYETV